MKKLVDHKKLGPIRFLGYRDKPWICAKLERPSFFFIAINWGELLAARLLEWMSPGQYLEHAAAADYDITKDPLIQIKLEEIRVENELSEKQAEEKERGHDTKATARALDPKQTVVEQAYAAALSDRWGIKHKPHKRHRNVEWSIVGIRLDEQSEEYLFKRSERRIAWMRRKQGDDCLP